MKTLHKLLFLSISLLIYTVTSPMEEKEPEEKKTKGIELLPLTSIIAMKFANKALKDYTEAYEEHKNYDQAYEAFINSLKGVPHELVFEVVYCYLINELGRADIFIRELVKNFENSNEQERNEKVLGFYSNFCAHGKESIIASIVREMDQKQLEGIQPTILQNLALYLTQNLHNKDAISSLEQDLEFFRDVERQKKIPGETNETIELKLNFIDQLFDILNQKRTIVHETLAQFPHEIQLRGNELLKLYKENNMAKFKDALRKLSSETKNEILMFCLKNYLVSNGNFEDILNAKKAVNSEFNYGNIINELIYYLSPQPTEILLKSEIDETSPTILHDAKGAKQIFANLFKELSSAYPKTSDSIYTDPDYFLTPEDSIKDITSLISKILNNYIYWLGIEFNAYIKDKNMKAAADLIIQFHNNVNDTRPLIYLLEDLLTYYILPYGEPALNHINNFMEILEDIKHRNIFDKFIYNEIIDGIRQYAYNEYSNEDLKLKGLTETQLHNLFKSLKT